jgi:S-DNA-T family DNA segregation ATPase FtsK/SpoIIIE
MNLTLSVHFRRSYFERFLTGESNRAIEINIPTAMSGFKSDISLSLEVWEGKWYIVENEHMLLRDPYCGDPRYDGSRRGKPVGKPVELRGGLRIDCAERRAGEKFVVVVSDVPDAFLSFTKYKLNRGRVMIGSDAGNNIRFNIQKLVSGRHALLEKRADGRLEVIDSSQNGTFVNGRLINDRHVLNFGETVGAFGLKIVYLGDMIAVNRPAADCEITGLTPYVATPAAVTGAAKPVDEFFQRSPRLVKKLDDETIDLEAPPNMNKNRRQPLALAIGPSITMILPMAAGAIFTTIAVGNSGQSAGALIFMGVITSVTAAIIGVTWALANMRHQKKTEAGESLLRETLFSQYLERMRGVLEEKRKINMSILEKLYPNVSECLKFTLDGAFRLWERNVNHSDFLSARLGVGDMPSPNEINVPKERFTLINDELADGPRRLRDEFKTLRGAPIALSFLDNRLVGVIADSRDKVSDIARLIAVQLAAYHSYTDLRMAFLYNKSDAEKYSFARWLPHVWSEDGETRMVAENAAGAGEALYCVSAALRTRFQDPGDKKEKARPSPHYVIFIADPELIEGEAMAKYLYAPTPEMGISVVLLYGSIGRMPNGCAALIRSDADFSGYCSLDGSSDDRDGVIFDHVSERDADTFARSISGFRVREERSAGEAPSTLSFLDMYKVSKVEDLDIYRNWLNNRSFESMKAMIGYRGADAPLHLDIHEKYHGPHGLVAGTTGSGKSETLQTYILSLAINFDPREVSFILIDYKGGGMAKSFEGIPHVAGIITNLGGNQTNRALAAINSEIKRRQAVFNEYEAKHIDEYIELFRAEHADAPMPHLLIISDEFAELKKEQPEFVRELVSAARVGRSLGIHLILATQDPSASVDDEIWSNSKFRLCLRVAGKQNSQAMLRRPDAAYITNAGRGYFQVGNDEIFELFQSGWSGAAYEPETPYDDQARNDIRMINLWGKSAVKSVKKKRGSGSEKVTQLEAVTRHISEVAAKKNISAISDIWLPPLPERVTLTDLAPAEPSGLGVTLGLADYPTGQRQFAFTLDIIREGHIIIAGPGGVGKTTLLQTLLYGLVTRYSPNQVNIYIADFNSRTLGSFSKLAHCGGVIFENDADKIDKLIKMLTKEMALRVIRFSEKGIGAYREYVKFYDDTPAIVFAIDNFVAFAENNDGLQEALAQLTRQSASYGIYLALTCANAGDIRGKIRQNINCGIGLQMSDRFEYEEVLGVKPSFLPDDRVTGRGLAVCDVGADKSEALETQFALPFDAPDGAALNAKLRDEFAKQRRGFSSARNIPQTPDDLSVDNLFSIDEIAEKCAGGRYMPLGYDIAEASPLYADLTDTFCFTVSGAARSGKTTFLKALMAAAKRQKFTSFAFDGPERELEAYSREAGARYITDSDALYAFMEDTLVPEIKRRNPAKARFIDSGYHDPDAYFASEPKLCLFITDMTAFCEAVYTSERDMKGYFERILLPKGKLHMFYMFARISPEDFRREWSATPLFKKFTAYREGLHLGGDVDSQRVFDFDVSMMQRAKKLPAGQGHIIDSGVTKRIAVVTV